MDAGQAHRVLRELLRPAVWSVDDAGRIVEVSAGVEDLTGWPRDAVAGRLWRDVAAELHLSGLNDLPFASPTAPWPPVLRQEAELTTRTGGLRYVSLTVLAPRSAEESLSLVVMEDLTPRRRAEDSLTDSEGRYEALFEALVAGVLVLDFAGHVLDCNLMACQLLGYDRFELLELTARDLVTEETANALPDLTDPALAGDGYGAECTARRQTGDTFPVELHLRVVNIGDQRRIVVHARDITGRHLARAALEEAQRFCQRILDATPQLVYLHDLDQDATTCANPSSLQRLGYSLEQLASLGPDFLGALMHPEDLAQRAGESGQFRGLADREVAESTYRLRDAADEWRTFLSRNVVFERDAAGRVTHLLGTAEDVTEKVRAQKALWESKETAWALLNATHDTAVLARPDGTVLGLNEAMARFLRRPLQDLLGTNALEYLPPEVQERFQQILAEVLETRQPVRFEEEYEGGHYRGVCYPVLDAEERVTAVAVFVQDVTEQRQAEASQRLATLGELAAGMGHEFNNILMGLMLAAETAAYHREPAEYERLTELVLRSSRRGAEICTNLMAFARPRQPQRQVTYVEEAIEEALALAARLVEASGVTVRREYDPAGRPMLGDPAQLEQVFLNLVMNACHAMTQGGVLSVHTACETPDEGPPVLVVSVTDTGHGIPPEHLPRVFEPFFTTKGRRAHSNLPGTGLGLSVSRSIVAAHGGEISVRSQVGEGSTFTLRFPLPEDVSAATAPEEPPSAAPPQPRRGCRVLLVEDEDDARQALAEILAQSGFKVTAVPSPLEALAMLRDHRFDLVVTDLLMPGGGGRLVLEWLQRTPGAPPALVVSGYDLSELHEQHFAPLRMKCLAKPFLRDALLTVIAELLGNPPPP